jgi:putative flippase GtrA
VGQGAGSQNIAGWVKGHILNNSRVIKYGIVGFAGVAINLVTLTLVFTLTSERGWVPPAVANVVSTVTNFVLHNLWTFSDRQHQGVKLVRGFLFFGLTSLLSIAVTTTAYIGFTRIAAYVTAAGPGSHPVLAVALVCQFVSILLGAGVSYTLNREFTWAAPKEDATDDVTEVTQASGLR